MNHAHLALCASLLPTFAWPQSPALNPRWNGTWVENPALSSLFTPGSLSIVAIPQTPDLLLTEDGQTTRLHCRTDPPAATCREFVPLESPSTPNPHAGTRYTVAANNRYLSIDSWRIVPDGSRLVDTDTYQRPHPGPTLTGHWRKVHSSEAPTTYAITVKGRHLTIATPNGELAIHATLDGSPTSLEGPSFSASARNGYTVIGPLHLLETSYRNGKVVAHGHLTLSRDGRTLTEHHTDLGPPTHTVTVVFTRLPFDTTSPSR